jgi:hypothetical protein
MSNWRERALKKYFADEGIFSGSFGEGKGGSKLPRSGQDLTTKVG